MVLDSRNLHIVLLQHPDRWRQELADIRHARLDSLTYIRVGIAILTVLTDVERLRIRVT